MKNLFNGLIQLFFPRYCLCCDRFIPHENMFVCIDCQMDLGKSMVPLEAERARIFGAYPQVQSLDIAYTYLKSAKVQKLIHHLKYYGYPEIGRLMGTRLGGQFQDRGLKVDYIVAVPIHWKKKKQRGYNQSEIIAQGVSAVTAIPIHGQVVKKVKHNTSQTRKNIEQRRKNVRSVFQVNPKLNLNGKSVLLLDDVLTTGATLEAIIILLIEAYPEIKISVAVLAMA